MNCETSRFRHFQAGHFVVQFALFLILLILCEPVRASSISIERAQLKKDTEAESNSADDAFSNALTLRIGSAERTAFLKFIEIRYFEERLEDPIFDGELSIRQLSLSTSTSRGSIADGVTTFGFGVTGLRYQLTDESSTDFFGLFLTSSIVKPIVGTRVFLKGSLAGDYYYATVDDSSDANDADPTFLTVRGEAGLLYSFPQFDLGLSNSYRRSAVEDSRTPVTLDSSAGVVFSARLRF
ncbi:hypothetical protein OAM69_00895 [bacterium]|nr:hypothetical protein [bacterium]